MEDSQTYNSGNPRQNTSELAKIFGEFLKRKSHSCGEIIEAIAARLVAERNEGHSFITVDDKEIAALKENPFLCKGEEAFFVLEGNRLYLAREHRNELTLARAIAQRLKSRPPENNFSDEQIKSAFRKVNQNQFEAVKNCLSSNFSIITGGPGTGKTTIIAALTALEAERNPDILIAIAAPTGKAAELLTQGLADSAHPVTAQTVHKLFHARPGTGQFGKNAQSPLECDLLIVDECSMLSLDVATKMFSGLRPETRVVLSGDHRQLEAIGSGAVLSSLLTFRSDGTPEAGVLKSAGVELVENHRAATAALIQSLAKDIREEQLSNEELCKKIISSAGEDYIFSTDKEFTAPVLAAAQKYWAQLPQIALNTGSADVEHAFAVLDSFRVVTAARHGKEGCETLNTKILETLGIPSIHHPGSALLITENCSRTGLANGDVGIVFEDKENRSVKVFIKGRPDRPLSLHDLPAHESAFAMTVHKAQGSGFAEVFFPLPQKETPLLSRELFYTALTRASKKITITGTAAMVLAALNNKSKRASALSERILKELRYGI